MLIDVDPRNGEKMVQNFSVKAKFHMFLSKVYYPETAGMINVFTFFGVYVILESCK